MRKLAHFALATLFLPVLSGVASAQNIPAIDVFGGYSYLSFQLPASTVTYSTSQRLALNGWAFSGSVALFHHFSAEADISGHTLSNCISTTLTCKNFTYLFGPRYSFGDRGGRLNGFVHGLIGEDRLDLPESQNTTATTTDNSVAFAGGGGIDYWFLRHVGVQLGPVDFVYTR